MYQSKLHFLFLTQLHHTLFGRVWEKRNIKILSVPEEREGEEGKESVVVREGRVTYYFVWFVVYEDCMNNSVS